MTHWAHINIFPDPLIALNKEIINHPKLSELLAHHKADNWELKLAEIANYCTMILDGDYLPEDINAIADILYRKLIELRTDNKSLVIISSSGF